MSFDLVITNGIIVNASGIIHPPNSDIAVKDGQIVCIGRDLPVGVNTRVIDAKNGYVTPGGIDGHCHLDQNFVVPGDTFKSGSRSAVCGGTTTIMCFAAQEKWDDSVLDVVSKYHLKATDNSFCDYGFHLVLTKPTDKIVFEELPVLVEDGITSVKIYMSYEERKLTDAEIMRVMAHTRKLGMTTLIHAENWDMICYIIEELKKSGQTDPYFHAVSRPPIVEDEASYRAISMSELMDTPILLVHVSTERATRNIRNAQTRMLPVLGETCPQYLYLMSDKLRMPNFEGAKYVCSPPLRDDYKEIQALWDGIANGTFTILSSDHCPFKFDSIEGKKVGIVNGVSQFTEIPNGLPGVETRLVLGYQGVVSKRITPQKFVEVTSYNPSLLYGLTKKGQIAPGYDADIVVWYPDNEFEPLTITNEILHHDMDYTPFEGIEVGNWPRYTILRGEVMWDRDSGHIGPKQGKFVKRVGNQLKTPRGQFVNEWRPAC